MAGAAMQTIWLQRQTGDIPWGFRLQGGRDYQQPLFISKVNPGSVAAKRLSPGDVVCRIGENDTEFLTHSQAMDLVKACGNSLQMTVAKGGAHYSYQSQPAQGETPPMPQPAGNFPTYLEQQLNAAKGGASPFDYVNQKPDPSQAGYNSSRPQESEGEGQVEASMPSQPTPDKIAVMAQKGGPGKNNKPFSYAPDVNTLRAHREKMRQSNRERRKHEQELTSATAQAVRQMDKAKAESQDGSQHSADEIDDEESNPQYAGDRIPSKAFKYLQKEYGKGEVQSPDSISSPTKSQGQPPVFPQNYSNENEESVYLQMAYQRSGAPTANFSITPATPKSVIHHTQATTAAVEKAKESRRRRRQEMTDHNSLVQPQSADVEPSGLSQSQAERVQPDSSTTEAETFTIQLTQSHTEPQKTVPLSAGHSVPSPTTQTVRPSLPSAPTTEPPSVPSPAPPPLTQQAESEDSVNFTFSLQPKVNTVPTVNRTATPWQTTEEKQPKATPEFDEEAYLAGQIPMMGGKPKPIKPKTLYKPYKATWEKSDAELERYDAMCSVTNQTTAQPMNSTLSEVKPSQPQKSLMQLASNYNQPKEKPVQGEVNPLQSRVAPSRSVVTPTQPVSKPAPSPVATTVTQVKSAGKHKKPEEEHQLQHFDEDAYLSGRISVFGDEPKPFAKPAKTKELAPWEKYEYSGRELNEEEFLHIKTKTRDLAPWERSQPEDENKGNFDEEAFLGVKDSIQQVRQELREEEEREPGVETGGEFDEDAYLSGQVIIIGGAGNSIPRTPKEKTMERAPWQKDRPEEEDREFDEEKYLGFKQRRQPKQVKEEEEDTNRNFDEDDYLSGKISIIGGTGSKVPVTPKEKPKERAPWEKDLPDKEDRPFDEEAFLGRKHHRQPKRVEEDTEERGEDFDEDAYLSGKVSIIGGPGSSVPHTPKEESVERAPWERESPEKEDKQFDEEAFLGRKSSITVEEDDDRDERNNKPFSEAAFLMGKIPLVKGGEIDIEIIQAIEKRQREMDEKQKQEEERDALLSACKGEFDEDAYLSGKIGIFGEKKDEGYQRPKKEAEKVPWQSYKSVAHDEFDEDSYLMGKITVGVEASVDTNVSKKKVRHISENEVRRPSWVRDVEDEGDFDESQFLASMYRRRAESQDREQSDETFFPSTLFRQRSQSREASIVSGASGQDDSDQISTSDESYNDLYYMGKKIPSKTFSSLDRVTARKILKSKEKEEADPLARMRHHSREDSGINLDSAIEGIDVGEHNPQEYLEMLKKTAEGSPVSSATQKVKTEEKNTDKSAAEIKVTVTTLRSSSTAGVGGARPKGVVVLRGKNIQMPDDDERVTSF